MQPLLVVDGLKKTYPNFKLNEVSFAVYEDCITGLSEQMVLEKLPLYAQF